MIYLKKNGNEVVAYGFEIKDYDESITENEWNECGCSAYIKDGEIILGKPLPTNEEQKQNRSVAYQEEVDPITSHIQRLRDEEEPDEEKIAELIAERNAKVEEIKERYPYYEEQKDAIEEG